MGNKILTVFFICVCIFGANIQAMEKEHSPRIIKLLNEKWEYRPISTVGKKALFTPVAIPHTWNAAPVEGTTLYERKTMVYQRPLEIAEAKEGKRFFLYFEGVNSVAQVFLNRRTVGEHLGGYTAFCYEITDLVKQGENLLEVWVSNAYRTDVLPISGDFNINGGIHRPCYLIITGEDCINPAFYASPGVFIHQDNISDKQADIRVKTLLSVKSKQQDLKLKTTITDAENKVIASNEVPVTDSIIEQPIRIEHPHLWNGKKNPYLYKVTVELYNGSDLEDRVVQRTGFRYFKVDSDKGFFLNGEYLNLYGFCRHEDVAGRGSALLLEDYQLDMELIKEAGATAMRLAHYPHAEPMYDLADENGIVLWTEIPMCGPGGQAYTGYVGAEGYKNNARQVLKELVYQKFNHPSICFWGICNEILVNDGKKFIEYDNPIPFIKELNNMYKSLDSSRLTALATCVEQSYYIGTSDLIAWNKYFGWYKDAAPSVSKFFDDAYKAAKGTPVGVSEYGAGASINQHQWPLRIEDRADSRFHPEEAQTYCHEGNWEAFAKRPFLWSKFIWVFADFPSYMRMEGEVEGYNDKGLITRDRRIKKDAFYFYKANWNPEPMAYITSRRFTQRTNNLTDIKVYTNLKEVTLYLNGVKIGTMAPDEIKRVVWNNVRLAEGRNVVRIEGKSGKMLVTDDCVWYYFTK
ncbi:glycoside hydrolase family 2 TIM barrel-domain containing protein [uncultured Bacteroides sp.]|uniref:glycoside hydrolase family 2 protein n=1 Tax=uncultured Bacteroides sp. TaxID=162156 RepID=UPI00280BA061|nr:glycoside hydrolase family 2 TIM barrel-domain containing protein [uncultured Bacteroides sp.]